MPVTQIHWINAVSASFTNASDWGGGVVPGARDAAVLDAPGSTAYTVTSSANKTVRSIQTAANATLDITGGTFTARFGTGGGVNAGLIAVGSGAIFSVAGTVDNSGTIMVSPAAQGVQIAIGGGGLTLTGGGKMTLESASNRYGPMFGGGVLTNFDNTISGSLEYRGPELINDSAGVIDSTNFVNIGQFTAPVTVINAGLIEASAGGVVGIGLIDGGNVLDNSAGGVVLAESGSAVVLEATVIGGTLKTEGTGYIAPEGADGVWDGTTSPVNVQGMVLLQTNMRLTLQGTINNSGTIKFSGGSKPAPPTIVVGAPGATLAGGGLITLIANAGDLITGATAGAVLTNVDNTIRGAGLIGAGSMNLINEARGAIVGSTANAMVIDTGASTITNAGLIEATGAGGVTIASAIANTGTLEAAGGTITVTGAVSGKGGVNEINAGTLDFTSSFTENVSFTGTTGVLKLAQSQGYAGTITGFSKTGGTSFDLVDIGFVGAGEATFSGTATSGVLTVTDGTHTAHITMAGDYTASVFTASSDGHGGTAIVDPAAAPTAPAHRFIAAAASLVGHLGGPLALAHQAMSVHPALLARPGTAAA
jgi:hypothetical protein